MKYIHNFDTVSAFTESYSGEDYLAPWVSYTKENQKVDYNRIMEVTLVMSNSTVTTNKLKISCSDLIAFTENGVYLSGSAHFGFRVYDKNENMIYSGGGNNAGGEYETLSDCERCNYLYNEGVLPEGVSYIYDVQNEKFNPIFEGLKFELGWENIK